MVEKICPHCLELVDSDIILDHRMESRRKAKIIASCLLQNAYEGSYENLYDDDEILKELRTDREEIEKIMDAFEGELDIDVAYSWDMIVEMIMKKVRKDFDACNM